MPFAFLPGTARPAAFTRCSGAPARHPGLAAIEERAPGARALVAALVACSSIAAVAASHAQERPPTTASRITQVTVAPGIATIERSARLPAGARSATFACLPASLDPDSLQISADAGVRVGEFKVTTEDRDVAAGCASPLDDRIRALEDRIADVQADITALRRVDRYLDHVAGGSDGRPSAAGAAAASPLPTPAAQIPATAEALRKTSADTLVRLPPLQRRQEALERELKPLRAERDHAAGGARGKVVSVAVNLATDREAGLRLSYQVRGPGWQPAYRARLDTATGAVVLERLAVVAQRSGEDWNDVRLVLTTQTPARATQGPRPGAWTVDVAAPPEPQPERRPSSVTLMGMVARSAAAPVAPAPAPADLAEAPLPDFDVTALAGSYATRFEVPQRLTVPASGQRTTLLLGTHAATARLVTRTVPARQPAAYLVAEIAPPAGSWPAGSVGLYRDGAFVGEGRLDFAAAAPMTTATAGAEAQAARTVPLSFGPDGLVRVQAEAPQQTTGSAGFTGSRVERRTALAYRIENRHTQPVTLQVIDAAPVSRNAKIEVESRYAPAPLTTAWEGRPGTIAWQQTLAPGAEARFTAEHTVRHDKDVMLDENTP